MKHVSKFFVLFSFKKRKTKLEKLLTKYFCDCKALIYPYPLLRKVRKKVIDYLQFNAKIIFSVNLC